MEDVKFVKPAVEKVSSKQKQQALVAQEDKLQPLDVLAYLK